MIDFGHKKVGKFNFLTCAGFYAWQKMEMRLFMWLDFYLHFWDCTKTRQRNEVLRDCFTASLLNGSLVFFFAKSKTTKEILMVLLANLTSYNEWEFTYFFNK